MRLLLNGVFGCLLAGSLEAQVWKGDTEGAERLRKAAERGDAAAMADVAFLSRYARGGVVYDQKLIFDYSRRSAEAGNAFGMSGLAFCYMNACGVTNNGDEAYRWAKKSADLGHPCGVSRLGSCHDSGLGVGKDEVRAMELFQSAAEAGSVNARMAYAGCFIDGEGVARQRGKGLDLLMELVREHDWSYAAEVVIRVIRKDELEEERAGDLELAIRTLERSSEAGNPRAMWYLAHEQKDFLDHDVFLNRIITAARMGLPGALENLRCYINSDIEEKYDFPVYGREEMREMFARSAYMRGKNYTKCGNVLLIIRDCRSRVSRLGVDLSLGDKLGREWILKGHEHYHTDMAAMYCRGVELKKPKYNRPDLAVAHAIYNCRKSYVGAWWLFKIHTGEMKGFTPDPAKAWIVGRLAVECEIDGVTMDEVRKIESKLTEEEWRQARGLEDEGYPTDRKFREWAREKIIESGIPLEEAEAASEKRRRN